MNDLFLFVDFQKVFEDGPWKVPKIHDTLAQAKKARSITAKVRNITTIVTNYLPPDNVEFRDEDDAWYKYFKAYPNISTRRNSKLYGDIEYIPCDLGWTRSGFSKWSHESTYTTPFNVFITGVSTECCVLATALNAVDAGATVYIISDACAASTEEDHELGLKILSKFSPNIQIIKTDDIEKMFYE